MQLRRCILPTLVSIYLGMATSGISQVVPSAREGRLPLTIGAGISNYNADWSNQRINGSGLWIDYYPGIVPRHLNGLGLEAEAHDLSWGRSPVLVASNFRQDTAGGGVIYSWHHFRNVRPYAKGLIEFGSFDFNEGPSEPYYRHDTRTVYSMGAGLDYRIFGHIWARGDYEYQTWQVMFNRSSPTPNGFTFGAMYDFRPVHSER